MTSFESESEALMMDGFSLREFYSHDLTDAFSKDRSHLDLFESARIDSDDFMTWKTKHPEHWSSEDIIDWIYSVADPLDMELDTVRGESFQNVSGQQLCRFSIDEFLERDKVNGIQLYECLQTLLQQSQFFPPSDFTDIDDSFEDIENLYRCYDLPRIDQDRFEPLLPVQQSIPSFSTFLDPLNGLPFDELSASPFEDGYGGCPPIPTCINSYSVENDVKGCAVQDSGYESAGSYTDSSIHSFACPSPVRGVSKYSFFPNSLHSPSNATDLTSPYASRPSQLKTSECQGQTPTKVAATGDLPPKRKVGRPPKRPSSSSSSSSSNDETFPVSAKRSKKKGTHLWKFMRSLLEDPTYNPNSIKWENKVEGVFRIVPGQSKFIAKLWGQRKNNPSMTFDKMSRSLRWCRTYGFLSEVPKDGNYPKKLCFRFGDRAANWQM